MDRQPKPHAPSTPPRNRKPYRRPQVRAHGSIHAITQARQALAAKFDGAGGGGKTNI
jgi:hypothetical protein